MKNTLFKETTFLHQFLGPGGKLYLIIHDSRNDNDSAALFPCLTYESNTSRHVVQVHMCQRCDHLHSTINIINL